MIASLAAVGCHTDNPVGEDCLRDEDCESSRCVQYICVLANPPVIPWDGASAETTSESGSPGDTGGDASPDVPDANDAD